LKNPKDDKLSKNKSAYSQSLVNISLLAANATQLKRALSEDTNEHQTVVIAFILLSIILQILILVSLVVLTMAPRGEVTKDHGRAWQFLLRNRIKSLNLFLMSLLTGVNIFINTFQKE
jgi:hypothetical protein